MESSSTMDLFIRSTCEELSRGFERPLMAPLCLPRDGIYSGKTGSCRLKAADHVSPDSINVMLGLEYGENICP